jgi:peroxiredoxin Q/BCP
MKTLLLVALALAVTGTFLAVKARAEALAVGADAPRPEAADHAGQPFDWNAFYSGGFSLVYFYPKADTPGCTKQACSLRDAFAQLAEKGVNVVGVSGDRAESQSAFRDKYKLPFPLLADPAGKVADAFGVPRVGPITARQAFLVKGGKIVWRDLKAATDRQAADVLAAIAATP